jgi:hypothetical protein
MWNDKARGSTLLSPSHEGRQHALARLKRISSHPEPPNM